MKTGQYIMGTGQPCWNW